MSHFAQNFGARVASLLVLSGFLVAAPAAAQIVSAGYAYWQTLPPTPAKNVGSVLNLDGHPIPADFFGPGSDELFGEVNLQGVPLNTYNGDLGPTDTIVSRPLDTVPLTSGVPDTIPIEIVALSLVSASPVT